MNCCMNHCRDGREMIGGFPSSDHSPSCENYKVDEFYRVFMDRASFICKQNELNEFMQDTDNSEIYKIEKVFMTNDQFKKLNDFTGF